MKKSKLAKRKKTIKGTASRPRLVIFRSNQHIYGQVIDDDASHTLLACSTLDSEVKANLKDLTQTQVSEVVGKALGKRLLEKNISTVIFDRGIRPYHGCVQAFAEGAKEVGLNF
jgi:large subunit ribosomal protein L18